MEQLNGGPTVSVVEGGISIDFSGYYSRPGIEAYNFFPMSRKRNFALMAERSASALGALLANPDFALGVMALRYDASLPDSDPDFITNEQFASRLAELFDQEAIDSIGHLVDRAYAEGQINIDTDAGGRSNEELQFTNAHALIILRWSFACVSVTPLITSLMDERDIQARDSMDLIMGCFCALLKRFEPADGSIDILTKLRKLTESRVLQTRYSDKVMWNYLRNISVDVYIFIDRLFRKFVTEGIPKLEQGTNVILFFHTFLKNQIRFQFTAKFSLSFKPIRMDVMDSDGVGAMEHLEAELVRRDESAAVLGEMNCIQAYLGVCEELDWDPEDDEIEHWMAMLRQHGISEWQRSIVTKFFVPRIGSVDPIRTRTLRDYTRMFLVAREWMHANGFPAIHDFMSARIKEGGDQRRIMARKRFMREFMESAFYRDLLANCFPTTSQSIIDSGVVIETISMAHVSIFESIPGPGEPADSAHELDYRIETIAQEVVRLIARLVHYEA